MKRRRPRKTLTARQRDVVTLVARGLTRREIAIQLGVREDTIKTHLKVIGEKIPGTGHELRRIRLHAWELLSTTTGTAP